MMNQDMGGILQQALQSKGQPTTMETVEPTQMEVMEPVQEESFMPEEIAQQLEAVKALMEQSQDPTELRQLQTVAEQLALALEAANSFLPSQVEDSPDPTMGQQPLDPFMGGGGF